VRHSRYCKDQLPHRATNLAGKRRPRYPLSGSAGASRKGSRSMENSIGFRKVPGHPGVELAKVHAGGLPRPDEQLVQGGNLVRPFQQARSRPREGQHVSLSAATIERELCDLRAGVTVLCIGSRSLLLNCYASCSGILRRDARRSCSARSVTYSLRAARRKLPFSLFNAIWIAISSATRPISLSPAPIKRAR
jgi:hypothetical protein